MKVVDVYRQYFAAECVYRGVERRGVLVTLTVTSDQGEITYEAAVTFFPHCDEEDYAVSYDAAASSVLYRARGRRSKKREAALLADFPAAADALAKTLGGCIFWEQPLRDALYA